MSSAGKSVVLVHGGFVDGSGWKGVYDILKSYGYGVAIVQNPTLSLAGDNAATRQILDEQTEPVVLVGHSYGGAVVSEAGTHEKVNALVYVTAFVPDAGESVNTLISGFPADGPAAADSAAAERLPVPGQGTVPRVIRRRCAG